MIIKQKYSPLAIEVTSLEVADVILTSGFDGNEDVFGISNFSFSFEEEDVEIQDSPQTLSIFNL